MSFTPYQLLGKPMYHMCVKAQWEEVSNAGTAYFPPTYDDDRRKTHASMHADKLLATANHFYKSSSPAEEEWICIQLDPTCLLEKAGISTLVEEPEAVGGTDAETPVTSTIRYPHIYGGIPTSIQGVVSGIFPMTRSSSDGSFLDIPGLL